MRTRTFPRTSPRRRALPVLLAAVLLTAARAGAVEPDRGIPAGPWMLTPAVLFGYSYDSNVFLRSENLEPPPFGDHALRATGSILATLPFRESELDLHYQADWLHYEQTSLERELSQSGDLALKLVFASSDRLNVTGKRTLGSADTLAFDPGGEVVFKGDPYTLDEYALEGFRDVPGHRGYRARLGWSKLAFDPGTSVQFFEFQGYDGEFGYSEPIGPSSWLVLDYEGRRFDHFLTGEPRDSGPYRRERSDLVLAGVRGAAGSRVEYRARVGWGDFRYPASLGTGFRGVVGDADLGLQASESTRVTVNAVRRPWSSFFEDNNFYLVGSLGVRVEHERPQRLTLGAYFYVQKSSYDVPVVDGSTGTAVLRKDRTRRLELYANLLLLRQFGLRVSLADNLRTTNFTGTDYQGRVYFAGIFWGWL